MKILIPALLVSLVLLFGLISCSEDSNPVQQANREPSASFTVTPEAGTTQTLFTFDASGSTDPDENQASLTVRWDWENDGQWDTDYSSNKSSTHQYDSEGIKNVSLQVRDSGGLEGVVQKQITVSDQGTVTDIDGNVYQTRLIGEQWWMVENLRTTYYRNGESIALVEPDAEWPLLTSGAYCVYGNDASLAETYGNLYNWFAVQDSRGLAPEGWHIPTDAEWKELEKYLGMKETDLDLTQFRGSDQGGKLKQVGNTHWIDPNTGADNTSGFNAVPGGYRDRNYGTSYNLGYYAYFWTSTFYNSSKAWFRSLYYDSAQINRYHFGKANGFSVRCVKDE